MGGGIQKCLYYFITHQNNLHVKVGDGGYFLNHHVTEGGWGDRTFYLWVHHIDHSYIGLVNYLKLG